MAERPARNEAPEGARLGGFVVSGQRRSRVRGDRQYAVRMPSAVVLLVYLLAVARVVRLVTSDRITQTPRDKLIDWAWLRACKGDAEWARLARSNRAEPPLFAYLVTCPWCVSVYLGPIAAPLVWFWGSSPWLAVPALALAISYGVGFLASKEG